MMTSSCHPWKRPRHCAWALARCEEADAEENPVVFHEAILYAAAFLYEHREEADYSGLLKMLRWLLFGVRRSAF